MTAANIIAVIIIALAVVGIIAIRIYSMKKNNEEVTIDSFMNQYSENIIAILKDFIKIMQVSINDYETKEEYNEALVGLCVESIKDNSAAFGIDSKLVNLFDTAAIVGIVCNILESNKVECFSVLESKEIANNEKYFDEEVIVALTEAEGGSVETENNNDDPSEEVKENDNEIFEENIIEDEETVEETVEEVETPSETETGIEEEAIDSPEVSE